MTGEKENINLSEKLQVIDTPLYLADSILVLEKELQDTKQDDIYKLQVIKNQINELKKIQQDYLELEQNGITKQTKGELQKLFLKLSIHNTKPSLIGEQIHTIQDTIKNEKNQRKDSIDMLGNMTVRDYLEKYVKFDGVLNKVRETEFMTRFYDVLTVNYLDYIQNSKDKERLELLHRNWNIRNGLVLDEEEINNLIKMTLENMKNKEDINLSDIKFDSTIKQYNEKTRFIREEIAKVDSNSELKDIEKIYTLINEIKIYKEENNIFEEENTSIGIVLLEEKVYKLIKNKISIISSLLDLNSNKEFPNNLDGIKNDLDFVISLKSFGFVIDNETIKDYSDNLVKLKKIYNKENDKPLTQEEQSFFLKYGHKIPKDIIKKFILSLESNELSNLLNLTEKSNRQNNILRFKSILDLKLGDEIINGNDIKNKIKAMISRLQILDLNGYNARQKKFLDSYNDFNKIFTKAKFPYNVEDLFVNLFIHESAGNKEKRYAKIFAVSPTGPLGMGQNASIVYNNVSEEKKVGLSMQDRLPNFNPFNIDESIEFTINFFLLECFSQATSDYNKKLFTNWNKKNSKKESYDKFVVLKALDIYNKGYEDSKKTKIASLFKKGYPQDVASIKTENYLAAN